MLIFIYFYFSSKIMNEERNTYKVSHAKGQTHVSIDLSSKVYSFDIQKLIEASVRICYPGGK